MHPTMLRGMSDTVLNDTAATYALHFSFAPCEFAS